MSKQKPFFLALLTYVGVLLLSMYFFDSSTFDNDAQLAGGYLFLLVFPLLPAYVVYRESK